MFYVDSDGDAKRQHGISQGETPRYGNVNKCVGCGRDDLTIPNAMDYCSVKDVNLILLHKCVRPSRQSPDREAMVEDSFDGKIAPQVLASSYYLGGTQPLLKLLYHRIRIYHYL